MTDPEHVGPVATAAALPKHTVAATRCADCRRMHSPPRLHRCLGCGSATLTDTRIELRGVFESWTTARDVAAGHGEWGLGLITLDAGPMLTARIRLNHIPLAVGAPVAGMAERRGETVVHVWFEALRPEAAAGKLIKRGAA